MTIQIGGDCRREKLPIVCTKCGYDLIDFIEIIKTSEKRIGVSSFINASYTKYVYHSAYLCPRCNKVSSYKL